jgi:adenosylmethionine-8-amino-7-oxononanoate aminotransferase
MTRVFHRSPLHDYPVAVRGQGVYLYDSDGKEYLDGSGGAAVSCLGHGHPEIINAIKNQLDELAYAHTSFFTNVAQEELASDLVERFGRPDARVYFLSGGSEANETALKLVRQFWVARDQPQKELIVSRHQSYHGNTLGALALSGNPQRSTIFGPLLKAWPKVDPCYLYRHGVRGESSEEYALRSANFLKDAIEKSGAENIAAFFAETVVGATLGAVAAEEGYFQRIRDICDQHDILLVLDEVMSGSGRTGTYFAFEQEGISPDIVTIAKGLAAGYQPLGATISRGFIHDEIVSRFGSFSHGHTYIGHATACAAGLAVSGVLREQDLLGNVATIGDKLRLGLRDALREHPNVGDVRGRGNFVGIELVVDRDTREPPGPGQNLPASIKRIAMGKGLLCYPGSGTADGINGAHILLAPAYTFSDANVDELVSKMCATLDEISI